MKRLTTLSRMAMIAVPVASQALGQEARATIVGRVTDTTGLAVAQAQVWITNTATGAVVPVQTNEDGNYSAL